MLGVKFAGDEVGEVADLHRDLTKLADDKAGNASRVEGVRLCLPLSLFPALFGSLGEIPATNLT